MNRPGSGAPPGPGQAWPAHAMPHALPPCHNNSTKDGRFVRRSGKDEGQATSCPHRVLCCTASFHIAPRLRFPPPRDRPFRAFSTCRLLNSPVPLLPCPSTRTRTASASVLVLSIPAGPPPHGIRHPLHVRVSPRRHLDIGPAWWEQPRHHSTSAVPTTGTATGTSTRTSTRWDAHGPSPSPSTIASRTTSP